MKNNTMAFCGAGETTVKNVGESKAVSIKSYVVSRSGAAVMAKSALKPLLKAVSHFNPTTSNLQKLADKSDAAFEEYKRTGKLPGRSRVV